MIILKMVIKIRVLFTKTTMRYYLCFLPIKFNTNWVSDARENSIKGFPPLAFIISSVVSAAKPTALSKLA